MTKTNEKVEVSVDLTINQPEFFNQAVDLMKTQLHTLQDLIRALEVKQVPINTILTLQDGSKLVMDSMKVDFRIKKEGTK